MQRWTFGVEGSASATDANSTVPLSSARLLGYQHTDLSVFRLIYIHTLLLTDVASGGGSLIQLTSVDP